MAETYRFIWGEVKAIVNGCVLAEKMGDEVTFAHVETEEYDLDFDRIGVVIRIPHDPNLNKERGR